MHFAGDLFDPPIKLGNVLVQRFNFRQQLFQSSSHFAAERTRRIPVQLLRAAFPQPLSVGFREPREAFTSAVCAPTSTARARIIVR
jgi:hypothetical protein